MGQRSPLVTLAATAAGFVVLLIVNATSTSSPAGSPAQAGAGPTTAATTTSAPSTTPSTPPSTAPATTPATSAPTTQTPTTPATQAVYAGRTSGREASLAVAVKGGRSVAYVCDGRRLEAWLTGTFTQGRLSLSSRTGERLTATVAKNTLTGSFTLRGRTLRFTIARAGPPAGLYRARNNTSTIGWIVLPDGSQVGVDNDGSPAPAPRLDPATRAASVNGVPVTAQSLAGDETF